MTRFSDYVVYVDESGDHSLIDIDEAYPVFVLAFCIFPVRTYIDSVVPTAGSIKFEFFGHDMVVLHEREIRKSIRPFDILLNAQTRAAFLNRMDGLMSDSQYSVVAALIDKSKFRTRRGITTNPYHVALEFGLERVFLELQARGQSGKVTHVIFEGRGQNEDTDLELEFRRVLDRTELRGMPESLAFLCVSKQTNSTGLQLADMIARPIGVHHLRPTQPNHAWDIIETKLRRSRFGRVEGYGLKIYP